MTRDLMYIYMREMRSEFGLIFTDKICPKLQYFIVISNTLHQHE
jgi:hypothetical protein